MSCFVAMKNPFVDQAILFSDASSREQAIEELMKLQVYIWPEISQEHYATVISDSLREIPFSPIRNQKILADLFEAGIQPAKIEVLERAQNVQRVQRTLDMQEHNINPEFLPQEKQEEQPTIQEVVKVAEEKLKQNYPKHLKEILDKIETQIKLIEVSSNDIATLATQFEIATCYDYKYSAYVKKLKNRSEKLWINLLESYSKLSSRVEKRG